MPKSGSREMAASTGQARQAGPAGGRPRAAPAPPKAVLFDMDGVITDTAQAHAAAWQRLFDAYLRERAARDNMPFRPFDPRSDYRRYVDGKPRHDGVRSFLAARGIELPHGDEDDAPGAETVCGFGKRKDGFFTAWLEENRVRVYPGTLRLLAELRAAGIPVAVFSASRNAEAVLRNAGVLELFDARVDGADLAQLGLAGKPDPAMLLEAARRLGAAPGRSAVFEDAIAGVEAGTRGGFGQVIGVARGDYGEALAAAGADLVVHDLSEMCLDPQHGLALKTLAGLPTVWDRQGEIRRTLEQEMPAVFLDYDGTLTPIVADHTRATLSAEMRGAVAALAVRCAVTIVSGRDLEKLRRLVALDSVWYAGSHGFDIAGPHGSGERLEMGVEFLSALDAVEGRLTERLAGIAGHSVERKRFAVAVHYRQVAAAQVDRLRAIVEEILADHAQLRRGLGKKVIEIRPDIDWNKGEAVLWLMQRLGRAPAEPLPLYVGDDITDEDAFHVLAGRGLCIAVRHAETRPTAADYTLADTAEVQQLLEMLAAILARPAAPGEPGS